jgi:hypothetical protein
VGPTKMIGTQRRPYTVSFFGIEALAPSHLGPADLRAWLMAPIAGEPLYRRLLEPLVGVNVARIRTTTGGVGRALAALVEERPVFGLGDAFGADMKQATGELLLPGSGLISLDVSALIARAEAERLPYVVRAKRTLHRSRGNSIFVRPANCQRGAFTSAPAQLEESFKFSPTGSVKTLLASSKSALMRRLPGLEPAGVWRRGVLLGARATVKATVPEAARAAVGAGSRVEMNVLLGEGAIVGEGCLVGEGAHVEDSILLDGAWVRSGEMLCGAVRSASGLTLYR